MKRALLLVPAVLIGLAAVGCGGGYSAYYVRTPPPAYRVEVRGYAPGPGYVWVDGRYRYGGNRYVWEPGRWQRPPHRHSRWEAGRWENSGRGYRWHDGRWR